MHIDIYHVYIIYTYFVGMSPSTTRNLSTEELSLCPNKTKQANQTTSSPNSDTIHNDKVYNVVSLLSVTSFLPSSCDYRQGTHHQYPVSVEGVRKIVNNRNGRILFAKLKTTNFNTSTLSKRPSL